MTKPQHSMCAQEQEQEPTSTRTPVPIPHWVVRCLHSISENTHAYRYPESNGTQPNKCLRVKHLRVHTHAQVGSWLVQYVISIYLSKIWRCCDSIVNYGSATPAPGAEGFCFSAAFSISSTTASPLHPSTDLASQARCRYFFASGKSFVYGTVGREGGREGGTNREL